MQTVLVNFTQIKCKTSLLNAIISPCITSMPVGVIVCFQVILESQINMAKVYFHGEMTMLKGYVPNSMYVTDTICCVF